METMELTRSNPESMRNEYACESCGNHSLEPFGKSGSELLECSICGAITGDDGEVSRVLLEREAKERGFGQRIYPLVRELEALPGLRVRKAVDGDSWAMTFPQVGMQCDKRGVRQLAMLLRCLALHQRELSCRWVVQLDLAEELLYVLKPDFQALPAQVPAQRVDDAGQDSEQLGVFVAADRHLSWWKKD